MDANRWLQKYWARGLLYGAIKIFSMKLVDEGTQSVVPGPFVLLVRHSSIADTVLPANLISNRYGIRLRYVLKKELLWDPCLDIVGNRLPNVFIDRSSSNTAGELAAIEQLCSNLGQRDGLLIYPEGTRFSPKKKEKILNRFKEQGKDDLYNKMKTLSHVLPPRPKGLKTILDFNQQLDALVCAHTGFEGAASFMSFWKGPLIGKTIYVKVWRIPGEKIPTDDVEYTTWLYDLWQQVDEWVDDHLQDGPKR